MKNLIEHLLQAGITTEYELEFDFSKHSTVGVGGIAEIVFYPKSIKEFIRLYDFFEDEYLGITECEISAELSARSVCVLRVTPVTDAPTVVASSRHISMGVPDLLSLSFDGDTVKGRSAVVAGDDYTVAIYNPKNKTVTKHKIPHDTTGELDWTVTL